MFRKILDSYKKLDKLTYKILKYGLQFCFMMCMVSVLILFAYESFLTVPFLYYVGLSVFRLSIIFSIEFIICALVVDSIKKQVI